MWEMAEIHKDKSDKKTDATVVATGGVSRLACERFIPVTVEPIDNSPVLIESQPLGQYHQFLLALCWQFRPLKQRPNYFSIMVLFRPACCVPPSFFSFPSICSRFDLKSERREGSEEGIGSKRKERSWQEEGGLEEGEGGKTLCPMF